MGGVGFALEEEKGGPFEKDKTRRLGESLKHSEKKKKKKKRLLSRRNVAQVETKEICIFPKNEQN